MGNVNPCGLGWRVRYWNFDHSTTATGVENQDLYAAFDGSDSVGIEIVNVDRIDAIHRLELDVHDLEVSTVSCNTPWSAGIRYVRMDQFYRVVATGVLMPAGITIQGAHDLQGLGPTIAFEHMQPVNSRLSAFVKGRGALIYGESVYRADDLASNDAILRTNNQDLTGILELQLGADWRRCLRNGSTFFVTAALEAQYWMNAGTGLPGLQNDDDGSYQDEAAQAADMGFFGFNVGAGLKF